MTPAGMVAVLDDAIASTRRSRHIALELRNAHLLGQHGRRLREPDAEGFVQFGYTRRQCEILREVILRDARSDIEASGA